MAERWDGTDVQPSAASGCLVERIFALRTRGFRFSLRRFLRRPSGRRTSTNPGGLPFRGRSLREAIEGGQRGSDCIRLQSEVQAPSCGSDSSTRLRAKLQQPAYLFRVIGLNGASKQLFETRRRHLRRDAGDSVGRLGSTGRRILCIPVQRNRCRNRVGYPGSATSCDAPESASASAFPATHATLRRPTNNAVRATVPPQFDGAITIHLLHSSDTGELPESNSAA